MKLACASKNGTYVGRVHQQRVNDLPTFVRNLCQSYSAWIVGSTAKFLLGLQQEFPKDIDVLVPFSEWNGASRLIPRGSPTNTMGGAKIKVSDGSTQGTIAVDVWGSTLDDYLQQLPQGGFYAVHPSTGTSLIQDKALEYVNSDGSGVAASDAEIARHVMPDLSI